MTNPFAVQPGKTIQDPQGGVGGSIASGIAGVLAQMQLQRENEMKQQQLATDQAQQRAIQQYHEAQVAQQQATEARLQATAQATLAGQQQVGGAVRASLAPPTQPAAPPAVPQATLDTRNADAQSGVFTDFLREGANAVAPGGQLSSVFGGVADENMEAAAKAVQGLQPKPEELPTNPKEFLFVQKLMQVDPSGEAAKFFMDNWVRKGPLATATATAGGDKLSPYTDATQKAGGAQLVDLESKARTAGTGLASLTTSHGTVDKAFTGLAANPKLFLARAAATLGIDAAKTKVEDTQTLWRLTGEQVMLYMAGRNLGSGTAISDSDREYYARLAGQDFRNEAKAIKFTIRMNYRGNLAQMQDALNELHNAATDHGAEDPSYARREKALRQRYEKGWVGYAQMLRKEGKDDAEIRESAEGSGVENVDALIRSLPPPPSIKSEADRLLQGLPK